MTRQKLCSSHFKNIVCNNGIWSVNMFPHGSTLRLMSTCAVNLEWWKQHCGGCESACTSTEETRRWSLQDNARNTVPHTEWRTFLFFCFFFSSCIILWPAVEEKRSSMVWGRQDSAVNAVITTLELWCHSVGESCRHCVTLFCAL